MVDLADLDALAQAQLVRQKELSPRDLIETAIDRIERTNPALNAVIHERFEKALADADRVDTELPFAGVPYVAKDSGCATAGDPYFVGLGPLQRADHRAPADSHLAQKFHAAGFVCVGRTNVPQLLLSTTTEPTLFGPTRNPWDVARSAGGSSGGSGAAVGSAMVPLADGNDAGGSIRIPAARCGAVGLKPTRSRVSDAPVGITWGGLNHEFGITRSIRDTAALLDAVAGPAAGDPHVAPPPTRPWRSNVDISPGRLRIRVMRSLDRCPTDAVIASALDATANLLAELGHDIEFRDLPELDEDPPYTDVVAVSVARDLERLSVAAGVTIALDELEPFAQAMVARGQSLSGVEYIAALDAMHAYGRRLARHWADFDLLVTPTCPTLPAAIGEVGPFAAPTMAAGSPTFFTAPFNVTGQPAISLPLHSAPDGMPIGVQLVGATGREDLLLQVGAQLELALPWAGRRPAVWSGER